MLLLPENWKREAYFSVICRLAGQIRSSATRTTFGRAMLAAALDVLVTGLHARNGRSLYIKRAGEDAWFVGCDGCFVYLPDLSRAAIHRVCRSIPRHSVTTVIGPPATQFSLFALAAKHPLAAVRVESLDYYIDLRVLLSSGDLHEETDAVFQRLLRAYHGHLPNTTIGRSLVLCPTPMPQDVI